MSQYHYQHISKGSKSDQESDQGTQYGSLSSLPFSPRKQLLPPYKPPSPESTADQYIRGLIGRMGQQIFNAELQESGLRELFHYGEAKENSEKLLSFGAGEVIIEVMNANKRDVKVLIAACSVVKNLSGNLVKFFKDGIGMAILDSMNNFPNDGDLQTSACYAIRTLARFPANAEKFVKYGVGRHIALALQNHANNVTAVKASCSAIWCLSSSTVSPDAHWDHNLPYLVVQAMLLNPMSEKIQEYGSGTLRMFGRPYSVVRMGGGKVILHAMSAFKRNSRLVGNCLKALKYFSLLRSNAEVMLRLNCTKTIITCLDYHRKRKMIQVDGCSVMWNLSQWQDARQIFLDDKIGRILLHIIQYYSGNGTTRQGSVKLVGAALLLLTRFGKQEEAVRDFLTRNICKEVSCSALRFMEIPQGEEVVAKSIDVLIQFCLTVPENKQLIMAEAEVLLQNIYNRKYGDTLISNKAQHLQSFNV